MFGLKINQIGCLGIIVTVLLGAVAVYLVASSGGSDSAKAPESADLPSSPTPSTSEPVESAITDISGSWTLKVDVTETNGVCVGEENDPEYEEQLTIVQTGKTVNVSGVEGAASAWPGTFDGKTLVFAGEKTDGSGITKASFSLEYDAVSKTFSGSESWSWSGSSGECSKGASTASASRG